MGGLVVSPLDDLNEALTAHRVTLNERVWPRRKFVEKVVDVDVVERHALRLNPPRPIFKPSLPIGNHPQHRKQQMRRHAELGQTLVGHKTGLDSAAPGHGQKYSLTAFDWRRFCGGGSLTSGTTWRACSNASRSEMSTA